MRYWNANRTRNRMLQERQRNAKGTPKFLVSWSTFWARMRSIENARTRFIENLWYVQRLWCYSVLKKLFEVLPKKVHRFSSFLRQFSQLVHEIVKFCPLHDHSAPGQNKLLQSLEKHKSMFRLPQNGRWRCTESSNFSGERFCLPSTAAKTRRSVR